MGLRDLQTLDNYKNHKQYKHIFRAHFGSSFNHFEPFWGITQ